jgi:hypothetical protein
MGGEANNIPPTHPRPQTAREVELVRLRALDRALQEQVERRLEEIRILRLKTEEFKQQALQRESEWRRRQGGEGG